MKIQRIPQKEKEILDKIKENWIKERPGIHLTDLIFPKQAFWKKTKPLSPSDTEILYFLSGWTKEGTLRLALQEERLPPKVWEGIHYTPDFFLRDELNANIPTEFKSRRRTLAKKGEEKTVYETYIAQLMGYCAMEGKTKGYLLILSFLEKEDNTKKTHPVLAFYEVHFTCEELEGERERLLSTKRLLEEALNKNDPSVLPDCPPWKCYDIRQVKIENPKCLTCQRRFATEWGLRQHLKSKIGRGHKGKPAVYQEKKMPKCQWFSLCKG